MSSLGRVIERLRDEHGWTYDELWARARDAGHGVGRQTINNVVHSVQKMPLKAETVAAVAAATGLPRWAVRWLNYFDQAGVRPSGHVVDAIVSGEMTEKEALRRMYDALAGDGEMSNHVIVHQSGKRSKPDSPTRRRQAP